MSKRPKIKQQDGTLVDLPLDAETLQGKTLEVIALKTDIPTFKTINGKSITGEGDITIEGGSGDSSITDLGTVNSLDDVALDVTEIGFYKFKLSKTGGAHLTACFMQVGLYYGDFTQLVLYTNEGDGKIRSAFRMKNSPTSEWSSWEYNNYMSDNYLGPINYQQNGPNKEVFLILGVTKNRDSLYPNGRERGVLLYFRGNGYETTTWAVIKYYTDYSTHKFYFTAVRIDDAESLTILEAKDIPYLEELTTSSITEEMYTTYTYAKSTDIPTKTSQLENDSGYTKQEDLNNYLPLSGGTMTGDISMGYHNISGIHYIEAFEPDSDSYATYAYNFIEYGNSSGDAYNLYFPEQSGTFVVKDESGMVIIPSLVCTDDIYIGENDEVEITADGIFMPDCKLTAHNIALGNTTWSPIITNYPDPDSLTFITDDATHAVNLSTKSMMDEIDAYHMLSYPNTSGTGDDTRNMYTWTLPSKSGTIALLEDLQGGGSGGVSEEDVLQIIEDNSSNTSQMDVDTSISIGTSADYNPNSDTQIPTTKAVQEMINVGGGSGGGSAPLAVEITYDELKTLRDNSNLVAGQQYRITDFVTTTIQSETKSAGNQFDIIVVADSTNTLNENARAIQHDGDTYFAESNLSAWELKYDLDNDTTKYAWADEVNGKGVIYWLKDEWGNECPYDFKNIQFIRESFIDEENGITFTNIYFYTFSAYDYLESSGIQSDIQDASIITKKESIDDYYNLCTGNIIKPYFNDVGSIEDPLNILNDIIFINIYSIDSYFTCYSNIFGNGCYSNTFGDSCDNNTFGNDCYNNTFGTYCYSNTFGTYCYSNTFGDYCGSNTFGDYCGSNTFGDSCDNNTFGTYCYHNTFGDYCGSNIFGNTCNNNTFTQNYCQYIIIENGCNHLEITSDDTEAEYGNSIQNIHIHQGVKGTYEEQKVITVARNLDYETVIGGSGGAKYTAGEGITISEDNVISINYKNGDTEAY